MNPSVTSKFAIGISWNLSGRVLLQIIALFTSVLLTRSLGAESYGFYVTLISFSTLLSEFISSGFKQTLNTYVSKFSVEPYSNEKSSYLLKMIATIGFLISIPVALIVLLMSSYISDWLGNEQVKQSILILSPIIVVLPLNGFLTSSLYGRLEVKNVILTSLISQSILLGTLALVFVLKYDINAAIFCFVISSFIATLALIFQNRTLILSQSKRLNMKPILVFSLTTWLSSVYELGLGRNLDILLLNVFSVSKQEIGFYNLSFNLSLAPSFLLAGIGPMVLSLMTAEYHAGGKLALAQTWSLILRLGTIFSIPLMIFVLVLSSTIVNLLYGKEFSDVTQLLQITIFFKMVYILVNGSFFFSVSLAISKPKFVLYITMICGLSNVLLGIILIPYFGSMGAVVATGVSTISLGFIGIIITKNICNPIYPVKFILKIISISVLSASPILIFVQPYTFIGLGIACVIFTSLWLLMAIILKPFDYEDRDILTKINPKIFSCIKAMTRE